MTSGAMISGMNTDISSEAKLIPHTLHRVDDNGVSVVIDTFPCRASATKRMRTLEATGHKQTYWIEALLDSALLE